MLTCNRHLAEGDEYWMPKRQIFRQVLLKTTTIRLMHAYWSSANKLSQQCICLISNNGCLNWNYLKPIMRKWEYEVWKSRFGVYMQNYLKQEETDDLPLSKCYNSPLTSTSEVHCWMSKKTEMKLKVNCLDVASWQKYVSGIDHLI